MTDTRPFPRRAGPTLWTRLPLLAWLAGCSGQDVRPPWVGSNLGETAYSTVCAEAASIPEAERIYFASREEAEATGYVVVSVPACGAEPSAARLDRPCTIERVIDGDTVVCEGGERVRLLMIDTPERNQEPHGADATGALEGLIRGQTTVRLEFDVQRQDQYGRTLAYLWLEDGRMLNEEMARAGYAVALVYPPNVRHDARIRAAVAEAREAGRGLWATEAFQCLPVDHRAGRC